MDLICETLPSLLDQPQADPIRRRIAAETRSTDVILAAYTALDPASDRSLVAPELALFTPSMFTF